MIAGRKSEAKVLASDSPLPRSHTLCFKGRNANPERAPRYFRFPSLMNGPPDVLLEAMATGMPEGTTETCGMTHFVEDRHSGLLLSRRMRRTLPHPWGG
jgi:hypothetical protein